MLAKAQADLTRAKDTSIVDRVRAQLAQRQADLEKARQDVNRYKPLAEARAIPQQDLDTSVAAEKVAAAGVDAAVAALKDAELAQRTQIQLSEAAVESAKASIIQADLNYSYTTIAAPIDGIIGKINVDRGNLVGKSEPTLLATVSKVNPIFVDFSIAEADYIRLAPRISRDIQGGTDAPRQPLELFLTDDKPLPQKGRVAFVDRAVDTKTGTIGIRAAVSQPRLADPPRSVRSRTRRDRAAPRRHPRSAPRRPGTAGRQDRAGGGGRRQGRPATHQGRRAGRRLLHRDGGAQGGRTGDRGGSAAGAAGRAGQAGDAAGREAGSLSGVSEFFIRRPIVAIVIAILTVLLGVFSLTGLSFEQYPFLAPPIIRITANFPGASAVAVEQSVATPIEQEVNGVESMIFMQSSNTSDGRMLLDVSFAVGVDQDKANVLSQNRVSTAQARLPQEVVAQGVTVKKQSPSILMVISLFSPNGTYDANYLINYCSINLRDQLLRIPGIAQVDLFGGTDYGMRIWLRPDKLAKLGITPSDVISSIKEQNLQAPAGRIGAAPSPKDQQFTYTVAAPGRLVTTDEFEDIIIRGTEGGAQVRIRDIGRAELGAQDYNAFGRLNSKPAGAMSVYLLPGADQLKAAEAIYQTLTRAKGIFPPDMDYKIVYDTTPVGAGLDPRDREDLRRGDHPGDPRRLHLPAEHPRHVHPAADGAGVADRHVHLLPAARLLGQHAVDVRSRARHRHRGGRRHRRRRGGDPPHRARSRPARGDDPGDEGGVGARHRHRADPVGRVRSCRLRARA